MMNLNIAIGVLYFVVTWCTMLWSTQRKKRKSIYFSFLSSHAKSSWTCCNSAKILKKYTFVLLEIGLFLRHSLVLSYLPIAFLVIHKATGPSKRYFLLYALPRVYISMLYSAVKQDFHMNWTCNPLEKCSMLRLSKLVWSAKNIKKMGEKRMKQNSSIF